MHADAEFDAALGRHTGIAFDEAILHLDGAAHGVDHAAELDEAAVAGALNDTPAMGGDRGIDQIATQPPQARQGAILVRTSQPAVANHIGDQDCCKLPGFGHGASSRVMQNTTRKGFSRASDNRVRSGATKPALPIADAGGKSTGLVRHASANVRSPVHWLNRKVRSGVDSGRLLTGAKRKIGAENATMSCQLGRSCSTFVLSSLR